MTSAMGRCLKTFRPERYIGTRTHDSENQLSIRLYILMVTHLQTINRVGERWDWEMPINR